MVERVVDGDTVIVTFDGGSQRVRILNVDAPESVKPDSPVECLGPEASAFTSQLLPSGTSVRLAFDVEPTGRYDRLLAAVYLEDGRSVGTELARAGLAEPVQYGDNFRFLAEIEAASAEARAAGVGLFASDLACAQ
ncbi:thermonuclease family protein [Herbiconiux sp. L3-i23]|uniref:thermonuclease family protein n=1 Tax=Herbiconiux sp. L3-i23 TaxID=2905871 RepID=UPI00206C0150|nr:thermonuclease family protein [Herbiconiux sp. L3-i23]BDI22544.1 hypothetical protein L3i23_13200 [Herbiconiux sp. L3-i23]